MNFILKLWYCVFRWKVSPDTDLTIKCADVILGQSFGLRKDSPGKSNQALAVIAKELSVEHNLPSILQWEIADCLVSFPEKNVIRQHHMTGNYLDTYEVIRQSAVICKKNNWRVVVIVAHPDHLWRVMMTAQRFGLHVVVADTSTVPYDEKSIQPWTRSFKKFFPRELAARLIYLLKGKI